MNTRDLYVEKMKAELDAINAKLDMFEAGLQKTNADTQQRLHEEFDRMRENRNQLAVRLDGMKESSGNAFEELKSGAEKAAVEIRRSLERAREQI